MIIVTLSEKDLRWATAVGHERFWNARRDNRKDQHGLSDDIGQGYTYHISGARGELAAARALDVEWPARVDTFRKLPDIDPDIEVRATRRGPSMLVRPKDKEFDAKFVLVLDRSPEFAVVGWLGAEVCRQDKWWKTPNNRPGAWFVPQSALHSIESLMQIMHTTQERSHGREADGFDQRAE